MDLNLTNAPSEQQKKWNLRLAFYKEKMNTIWRHRLHVGHIFAGLVGLEGVKRKGKRKWDGEDIQSIHQQQVGDS